MTDEQKYLFKPIGTNPDVTMTINQTPRSGAMTVCVMGMPRGGTTMVAAVVHALGVNLGPDHDLGNFHYEDQTMNRPYLNEQHEYIKKRNVEHDVWGWKDPGAVHPFKELAYALRFPRVIMVFRDPLAVIQGEMRFDREYGVDPRPMGALFDNINDRMRKNWEFVSNTSIPTLLVSYERAMNKPEKFIDEVIEFLQLTPDGEQRKEASLSIGPEGGYLQWAW